MRPAPDRQIHWQVGAVPGQTNLGQLQVQAFAGLLHQRARVDWGYGGAEKLSHEDLIRERYRGIRPAPGTRCEKWLSGRFGSMISMPTKPMSTWTSGCTWQW